MSNTWTSCSIFAWSHKLTSMKKPMTASCSGFVVLWWTKCISAAYLFPLKVCSEPLQWKCIWRSLKVSFSGLSCILKALLRGIKYTSRGKTCQQRLEIITEITKKSWSHLTCIAGVFGAPDLLGTVIEPFRAVFSSVGNKIRSLDYDGFELLIVCGQVSIDVDGALLLSHALGVDLGPFTRQRELLIVQIAPRLEHVYVVLEAVGSISSVVLVSMMGFILWLILFADRCRVLVDDRCRVLVTVRAKVVEAWNRRSVWSVLFLIGVHWRAVRSIVVLNGRVARVLIYSIILRCEVVFGWCRSIGWYVGGVLLCVLFK